jgi:hypothetical protein
MKRGVPPTARNARTGEFTPPGITRWARSNNSAEIGASLTSLSLQPDGQQGVTGTAGSLAWTSQAASQ